MRERERESESEKKREAKRREEGKEGEKEREREETARVRRERSVSATYSKYSNYLPSTPIHFFSSSLVQIHRYIFATSSYLHFHHLFIFSIII